MNYVAVRVAHFLSLWIGVIAAAFVLFHLVPSDPVRTILGPNAAEQQVIALRQTLGLDRPVATQFTHYLQRAATLEFGESYVDRRPVGPEVRAKLVITISLAALTIGILFTYLIVVSILDQLDRGWRWLGATCNFVFVATPVLFSGVAVGLAAVWMYPYTHFSGSLSSVVDWLFLLPPAFVLALYPMGVLGRIASNEMRAVASTDYVQAARARGLTKTTVLVSYVLRNSLVPLLAALGNQLPLLLTSAFIVEIVFSVPGIGSLLLKSVLQRDLPMLEGIVVATSLLTIILGLLLEVCYPLIDPRIGKDRVV